MEFEWGGNGFILLRERFLYKSAGRWVLSSQERYFQGRYNKLGIREVKKDNFKLTRMRERKSRDLDRVRDV